MGCALLSQAFMFEIFNSNECSRRLVRFIPVTIGAMYLDLVSFINDDTCYVIHTIVLNNGYYKHSN